MALQRPSTGVLHDAFPKNRMNIASQARLLADARPVCLSRRTRCNRLAYQAYDADGHPIRSAAQIGTQWLVACQSYSPSGKLIKRWGPAQTAPATTCPSATAPTPVADTAYDDL